MPGYPHNATARGMTATVQQSVNGLCKCCCTEAPEGVHDSFLSEWERSRAAAHSRALQPAHLTAHLRDAGEAVAFCHQLPQRGDRAQPGGQLHQLVAAQVLQTTSRGRRPEFLKQRWSNRAPAAAMCSGRA